MGTNGKLELLAEIVVKGAHIVQGKNILSIKTFLSPVDVLKFDLWMRSM